MNLHIVPDSKFVETFYKNLQELNLLSNNRFIVRTSHKKLVYIKQDLPFAPLYSDTFSSLTGDTSKVAKVFIHQLSPLMYRWIARHSFNELNWMIWGGDLYNLPFIKYDFYESLTEELYIKKYGFKEDFLYLLKLYLTNMLFMKVAYSKINYLLTWMASEYQFALQNISSLKAQYSFFFYENPVPYQQLDFFLKDGHSQRRDDNRFIVGNSGTPTNNHLDAIKAIQESGVKADLFIPVSYGDKKYIDFLKRNVSFYQNGNILFIDRFMETNEYIRFLMQADGMIMNHIRPQGYGNIFMMMYLGKPVFLNDKNISLSDLRANNIRWNSISTIKSGFGDFDINKKPVMDLLSHEKLIDVYTRLFS